MIGDQRFEIIVEGTSYKLSDGTALEFLSRENGCGITNEEMVGVLLNRLRAQNRASPCKESSRAITALESVEEIFWRREVRRRQEKESFAHA